MKVRDIMTQRAVCCGSTTNVGAAVEMLWVNNCGMLPVVDTDHKLIGIVTDRDICIALGTRRKLAGDLTVREVATAHVFTCSPNDEIHKALTTMAEHGCIGYRWWTAAACRRAFFPWITCFYTPTKINGKALANSPRKK